MAFIVGFLILHVMQARSVSVRNGATHPTGFARLHHKVYSTTKIWKVDKHHQISIFQSFTKCMSDFLFPAPVTLSTYYHCIVKFNAKRKIE